MNNLTYSSEFVNARTKNTRIFALGLIVLMLFSEPLINSKHLVIGTLLFWMGYPLVIVGVLGRIYCSLYIGGHKGKMMVQEGPYRIVRNPLYVFSFIGITGICLQSGMMTLLVIIWSSFFLYYPKIVQSEESFLSQTFGEQFITYAEQVPRWIPNFNRWQEPKEWGDVHLSFVRRTLIDASILFVAAPIFLLINKLHHHGLLYIYIP